MKTYLVGGAVRDKLLGIPPHDQDYVVVGSTHEEMIGKGFLAVGKSHSVYLHPETKEEYTLAGNLKDDLERRDLTINALAMDGDKVVDFFDGQADLSRKILRHVRETNFYVDPLRVYRVARFLSQFPDFTIDPDTFLLMRRVAKEPLFLGLAGERIFLEFAKALAAQRPSLFFRTLMDLDALEVHFPELANLNLVLLDKISGANDDLLVHFGGLCIGADLFSLNKLFTRLIMPNDWRDAGKTVCRFYSSASNLGEDAPAIVDLFYKMDAYRKDLLVHVLSEVLRTSGKGREGKRLMEYFDLTKNVSSKDTNGDASGKFMGEAIRAERISKLKNYINI